MKYAISGLMLAVLMVVGVAGAQSEEGPSPQERAVTADRIEAARDALRALPSKKLIAAQQARSAPRIVNGDPEVKGGQWAWTVSVIADGGICGGAYVAPHVVRSDDGKYVQDWVQKPNPLRWVVTAAHCLFDRNGNRVKDEDIKVFGGTLRTDASVRAEHHVEGSEVHDSYDPDSHTNDIALLRISDPVNVIVGAGLIMTSIRLPADIDITWLYKPYTALTVHGWGRTSEGGFLSPYLQKVRIPHVERTTCAEAYGSFGETINPGMMCAGFSNGGLDSCQGDSGGPLSFIPEEGVVSPSNAPILTGVVSWGIGCARQNLYGVYTNVLHMRSWMEKTVVNMQP